MRLVAIGILLVVAVVCGGCGKIKPTQAKAALDKMLRKTKPAPNAVIPPLQPVRTPRLSTNPLLPPGSVATTVSAQISHSKAVGNRLVALKPKIPAHIYARLWNEWQANDQGLEDSLAQIRSLESRCTCGLAWCKNCAQRKSLERRHQELAARNTEIESLLAQYG